MTERNMGENFKVVISTKKTLFGAPSSDFNVYYADVDDLSTKVAVSGGLTEAVETIASGNEHTATTTAVVSVGAKLVLVDDSTSTLEEGDTIEYATGKYAYVSKIVGNKVYLKSKIKTAVTSGATLTQAGNTGEYTTADIAIPAVGEYIVAIEGSDYGILVEQRVKIVDETSGSTTDPDAPDDTVAVAY